MSVLETPIEPATCALLIMDYQPGIIGRAPNGDALVAKTAEAIDIMRRRGGTIAYVRVAFEDADITAIPQRNAMFARIGDARAAFHATAPASQIDERLPPRAGDIVVRKTRVGAFSTTDLARQVRERNIETLILAGLSTSGVVLSTVRDAADRDFRIVVLSDATSDPDPSVHEFLVNQIFPRQAVIVTVAELGALFA